MSKGFVYTSLTFLVLSEVYVCLQQDSDSQGYTNPCHVNGSPAVAEVNETQFRTIVHRIITDQSSGVSVQCQNIYFRATSLKNKILSRYSSLFRGHLQTDSTPLLTCNLASSGVNRSQVVECMKMSYELLLNLSMSANVVLSTNFAKQNVVELLSYLQRVKGSIERGLCSIASNGLSQLVDLNSTNLHIGPLDFVRSLSNSSGQARVVYVIYQLTSAIENACSTMGIPQVLNQLLLT